MKELISLFLTFARIGAFTFGGGYAMLPMLQREVVQSRKWATEDEVLDYFAIGQCTPGVIFVNTATFIGYKRKGIPGAIFATAGRCVPFTGHYYDYCGSADQFCPPARCTACIRRHPCGGRRSDHQCRFRHVEKSVVDKLGLVLAILSFIVATFVDISPVWLLLLGAVIGIVVKSFQAKEKGGAK